MLKLYNSLTNKLEEFKTLEPNKVKMYVCGPTVYNYIHIGNARPVVFYDIVKRYLEFCGYEVIYASNITDIDDKIINKAILENKSEKEVATFFENAYFEDVKKLNSRKPDLIPHATMYINDMIHYINTLIEKGYAYESNGNVYFRISSINDYGTLSNQSMDDLTQGARVDVDSNKENPLDFTLWKDTNVGIKWDSPFGAGRPGWHTECVCMNNKLFGESLDIHGGGMDLKFPHHENEIAQHEALHHNHLANYWLHVGRVDLNGAKMSKSLGNVIFVKDLTKHEDLMTLRMLLAFAPYRAIINYSRELFDQYLKIYQKWERMSKQVDYFLQSHDYANDSISEEYVEQFKQYMDDDFNVQNVLTLLEQICKEINQAFRSKDYKLTATLYKTFKELVNVLGIDLNIKKLDKDTRAEYLLWEAARIDKDFEAADKYRNILIEKGIL